MKSTYEPRTIAAIATPPGEGGIAVVRISGPDALEVADQIFSGPIKTFTSHTAHLGKVYDLKKNLVDEALALVMLGKRSYAGEDTVEIHCHGGSLITRKVLNCALSAGAKMAEPGEFTMKAFFNGKIDLAQAEAVQELIGAQNELALQAAEEQLMGTLSEKVKEFQKKLLDITAVVEAWVDYPEEGLEFASTEAIISDLENLHSSMKTLSESFHDGKRLSTGLSICLVGEPNVGKSSLLNRLLGHERAIVTDIPGTTRDLLEESLRLGSLHFQLTDTAGIRETKEIIEKEGIRRSLIAAEKADIILAVLDCTKASDQLKKLGHLPKEKTLLIWNKKDLPHSSPNDLGYKAIKISALDGTGIEELKKSIDKMVWEKGAPDKNAIVITKERHHLAICEAMLFIEKAIYGLKTDISPEFLTLDLRAALKELGKIIGIHLTEDILGAIFSKFCVGK